MTTLTGRTAGAGALPSAEPPARMPSASRRSTWRGSWAVALRMARRDVRRHKGRSLIVLLMVGIPTALLVFGLSFYATASISGAERIPFELGNAVARIDQPSSQQSDQGPDGSTYGDEAKAALPVPGYVADAPLADRTKALSAYFHGRAVPWTSDSGYVLVGDRSIRAGVDTVDGRAGLGSILSLATGRWPAAPGEVAVNQAGVTAGLPSTGPAQLTVNGTRVTVQVVGVVDMKNSYPEPEIVTPTALTETATTATAPARWYLLRPEPMAWAEVRAANAHGMGVLSAEALRHPPAAGELAPSVRDRVANDSRSQNGLLAAGGAILLMVTTLLVGPAFAVSAARQRRTLALAASNGASTPQLRRTVLAQAVVLGVVASAIGAALGVVATWLASIVVLPAFTSYVGGPLDVPAVQVLGVAAVSMLSAVIAALLPARRLGRLDIVGVMKGQNVSPRLSRLLPIAGLVGAVVGGVVLFTAIVTRGNEVSVVGGAVVLIVGALCLVPLLLVLAARFAKHLPVSLRMATRDAARQRSRSGPSVAAVVGALAALTMLLVGLASDTEQQRREYQPQNIAGEGSAYVNSDDPGAATAAIDTIHRIAPQLLVTTVSTVTQSYSGNDSTPVPFVQMLPPGCTLTQAVSGTPDEVLASGQRPRCGGYGTNAPYNFGSIDVMDAAEIGRRVGLTDAEVAGLRTGGAVAIGDSRPEDSIVMVRGTFTQDPSTGTASSVTETGRVTLPIVARPKLTLALASRVPNQAGLLVTPETAKAAGWSVGVSGLLVRDPAGSIGSTVEERLTAALDGQLAYFSVERGFQRADALVMAILVGIFAFLVLVITLTSTALSLAEQQKDDGTLAALGATRSTRRSMAAAQAFVLSGIGAVIGFAVGLVPGIAITYPLTGRAQCDVLTGSCQDALVDPTIVVPWLWLSLAIVGVPVLAALISAASIRRAPTMTRRAT